MATKFQPETFEQLQVCTKCGIEHPYTVEWFPPTGKPSPDGKVYLKRSCRACAVAASKAWKMDHFDHYKKQEQGYSKKNSKEKVERARRWRLANLDRARKLERKSHSRPEAKERSAAWTRTYRQNHPDEWRMKRRAYEATPKRRAAYLDNNHRRRAALANTATEPLAEFLWKLRKSNVWCYLCWKPIHGSECEIDHIVPLSRGGSHTRDNIAPACRSCNRKKSNKELRVYLDAQH